MIIPTTTLRSLGSTLLLLCLVATGARASAPAAPAEDVFFDGAALKQDGEIIKGNFRVRTKEGKPPEVRRVLKTKKPRLREVELLVDLDGHIHLPLATTVELRSQLGELAAALAEDVDTSRQEFRATFLSKCSAASRDEDPELARALLADALIEDPDCDVAWEATCALDLGPRVAVWREVLAKHPKHRAIAKQTRTLFPEGVMPRRADDTLAWLDFYADMQTWCIEIIHDPDAAGPESSVEKKKLGTLRTSLIWGDPKLIGYRSESVFLVTPVRDPRILSLCLRRAEAVCRTLKHVFGGIEAKRKREDVLPAFRMMTIYFFESRKDYLRLGESLRSRGSGGRHADTAGCFNSSDRVSRFYLPEGAGAEERLLKVLSHELTHHWLVTDCLAYTNESLVEGQMKRADGLPGHWIVEGFASLIEDFDFDPLSGSYDPIAPDSQRLDFVAGATAKQLIPWNQLYGLTNLGVNELNAKGEIKIASVHRPNGGYTLGEWALFYAQSAATCHELFSANDGRDREKLLRYVIAYYTGDEAGVDVERAFGVSAEVLGERARANALEVVTPVE